MVFLFCGIHWTPRSVSGSSSNGSSKQPHHPLPLLGPSLIHRLVATSAALSGVMNIDFHLLPSTTYLAVSLPSGLAATVKALLVRAHIETTSPPSSHRFRLLVPLLEVVADAPPDMAITRYIGFFRSHGVYITESLSQP
jgi:hypothetical protein